jgi:hypothetical protein
MKRTMRTIEVLKFGEHPWRGDRRHAARIERVKVLFSNEDRTRELLKFCYVKNDRHARTHLTIDQDEFVSLFRSAVDEDVFSPRVLKGLFKVLSNRH